MPLRVEPVRTGRDLHRFVTLPWTLYGNDPHWIPPLIGETKKLFDPAKNPFYAHGEIQPFTAIRGDEVVGRIAAIRNIAHEEFHEESVGFFGFFECVDDPEVAAALIETVREFLRERGLATMRGPMNPSTNEECGLLVDGFDSPPMIMMPHNLPYYEELFRRCGLEKTKDLFAYLMESETVVSVVERGARIARKRNPDVVVRPFDKKRFAAEVDVFRTVYNAAWERNWGFVPMTDAEIEHMAAQLKQVLDPGLVQIAEMDGKPIGFAMGLPDINQAVRHANGKLFPLGLLKILWYARKIDRARILVLGLIPEYRNRGIDAILYYELFKYGTDKGIHTGEFSWILEDNLPMMKPLEKMGARIYKTYRIYESPVERG